MRTGTLRSLDPESATILHRLTAGLADPAGFGLISHEIGDAEAGAPTVAAERLSADRYVVTRYIELDTRTKDPEVNDRVETAIVIRRSSLSARATTGFRSQRDAGTHEGDERDPNELAVVLLRLIAHEQAGELARGLDWPTSPGGAGVRVRATTKGSVH